MGSESYTRLFLSSAVASWEDIKSEIETYGRRTAS